ncbi:hypothetical protein PVAND_015098 [Polypedilum vanderplanki]|uniref:ABC transporter domain-containing protein n=1 Tax=Polypedilum vanderplanki TaxID=319348 RepID=A0A9J6BC20_POLVA|nr:hypothetical protein PVAND_015098 [Polypedilum vanderplanki]
MSCVEVKNVFFSYNNGDKEEKILNGINMSVDRGTIYTLIGASGCGKTTLLSCLMCIQKPQSGELKVFNQKSAKIPKLIGFMPQQNSLVAELTINETLQYFGHLYEMKQEIFDERFEMISELLDLPDKNLQIRDLSGGEQRRISLAATIIHDPKLLILDEPTVGLDFLLREKIWEFLFQKTTNDNVTAIITTHYISEAANAHRCGFMRNGILIAEDSPNAILDKLNIESLDEAFYHLCTKKENENQIILESENFGREQNEEKIEEQKIFRPKIMKGLLIKEFHRIRRQPLEIFIIFIMPVFQFYLFLIAIGAIPNDLILGIVNNEDQNCNKYTINNSIPIDKCSEATFSCEFTNHVINNNFQKVLYNTHHQALHDFKESNLFGFVEIPKNFTQIIFDETENRTGAVEVFLDNSKYHLLLYTKSKIMSAFLDFMDELAGRCNVNELIRGRPIKFEELYAPLSFDIRTTLMTAIMLSLPFTMTNIFALLIISDTRIAGVWNRTLLCGVKLTEIILANAIECIFISIVIAASMIIGQDFIFGAEVLGSKFLVFSLITGICIVGFMMGFFISILCDKFQASSGLGQLITILTVFTTGLIWPVESLSPWIIPISYIHPLTFPFIANRNIILKGVEICHSSVILGFFVINAWIIVLAVSSYFLLKTKKFSRNF